MKALKALSILGMGIGLVFTSCTVEKRVATRGYHVEWKGRYTTTKNTPSSEENVAVAKETPVRSIRQEVPAQTQAFTTVESVEAVAPEVVAAPETAVSEENATAVKATGKVTATATVASEKKAANKVTAKKALEMRKAVKSSQKSSGSDVPVGLLYVLCFLVPFVAVGIVTDWDGKTVLYNILWTLLCGIPGIIHAIIVVNRES